MSLTVTRADGLVTLQDRGRHGYAHLGVPAAGALDRPAAALANRLVGNTDDEAVIETTLLGVAFTTDRALTFSVTGAHASIQASGRARPHGEPVTVPAGATVEIGPASEGVRTYVAVAGGIAVAPVLGSRSTDTLAWLGPPRVVAGTVLPVGPAGRPRPVDAPAASRLRTTIRLTLGPRADWFTDEGVRALTRTAYVVGPAANRIGLRLRGRGLTRRRTDELASEGMVAGAIQVPPDGQPVVLLRDHPTTGGYPVIGVVVEEDLAHCAQLRPGDEVRFTTSQG
ncbi:MAG: biotin-dependent carboxyltransferase family protein [Nocardioides sp.]|uniref:5-oxoprolinase subunit C family protein n=1 Tax=Nocardioides sp. TaxID=35761 RepID=UPI0039E2767D